MKKSESRTPIDRYITEVREFLPYPNEVVKPILNELRKDVQDAMGSDKRPPSVVFGSPKEVALNLSLAQDWGMTKASWKRRTIAFIIDFLILSPILLIFFVLPLVYFFPEPLETVDKRLMFAFVELVLGIPTLILMLLYFTFLEKTFGLTIGKKLLGLLVIDESGIRITWSQAILRNLTKTPITGQFLVFDVIIGIFSEKTKIQKQRVFDLVSGTIVIKQNKT